MPGLGPDQGPRLYVPFQTMDLKYFGEVLVLVLVVVL